MIRFEVYGTPVPQGSMKAFMPKGRRFPIVTADNAKTKPWRQAIIDAVRRDGAPDPTPFDGPVALDVLFYLPRPKSAPKAIVRPAKKPDLDKLVRAVCDALTAAGVWRDDSQVVSVHAGKVFAGGINDCLGYNGVPRAAITVQEA
jgi:crossover junction endodeoxyribonuclease RusA